MEKKRPWRRSSDFPSEQQAAQERLLFTFKQEPELGEQFTLNLDDESLDLRLSLCCRVCFHPKHRCTRKNRPKNCTLD